MAPNGPVSPVSRDTESAVAITLVGSPRLRHGSQLTSADRELKLVPKKGRPVTQCHHCRQERKKRSAHVKCDCAEPDKPHHPKEKCIHLREAELHNQEAHYDDAAAHHDKDIAHMAAVAEEQGCCCHHGGKCSCALVRKDSTDEEGHVSRGKITKPRLQTTRSDSSIHGFGNGHHKLTHRNHAAHESGMPYRMPRSKTDHYPHGGARRSVDNLGLNAAMPGLDSLHNRQQLELQRRLSRSDRPSPKDMANLFGNAGGLTSNALGVIDFAGLDTDDVSFPPYDNLTAFDESAFGEWSSFPNDMRNVSTGEPLTFLEANNLVQPALTAASSGTQSEIDEVPIIEDAYPMPIIQELSAENGPVSVDSPSQINRRSLPPSFFGNVDFTIPGQDSEWQTDFAGFDGSYNKPMMQQEPLFNDPWQQSRIAGRPAAQSVGSSHAPGNDILKQLFPDMELDDTAGSELSPQAYSEASDLHRTASQSWADGSMSIPNDIYAEPYLGQSFGGH